MYNIIEYQYNKHYYYYYYKFNSPREEIILKKFLFNEGLITTEFIDSGEIWLNDAISNSKFPKYLFLHPLDEKGVEFGDFTIFQESDVVDLDRIYPHMDKLIHQDKLETIIYNNGWLNMLSKENRLMDILYYKLRDYGEYDFSRLHNTNRDWCVDDVEKLEKDINISNDNNYYRKKKMARLI